jgi:hypothetical protein
MATRKAEKLREDAYRQNLENGIKALLASQEEVVAELRKLTARLKALEEKRNVKPSQTRR